MSAVQDKVITIFECMPDEVQNRVYGRVWELAGSIDRNDPEWGRKNARQDLLRLAKAVQDVAHQIFDGLSSEKRSYVEGRVWYHAGQMQNVEWMWGAKHAKDPDQVLCLLESLVDLYGVQRKVVSATSAQEQRVKYKIKMRILKLCNKIFSCFSAPKRMFAFKESQIVVNDPPFNKVKQAFYIENNRQISGNESFNQTKSVRGKDDTFIKLAACEFQRLFKKSIATYIEKQIVGVWSKGGERLTAYQNLCPSVNDPKAIADAISYEVLVSFFTEEEKEHILSSCSSYEWDQLWSAISIVLQVQMGRLHEVCAQQFLSSFSQEEKRTSHAWKIPLAMHTAYVKKEALPHFYRRKFQKLCEGLPERYARNLPSWEKKQKSISTKAEKMFQNMQGICGRVCKLKDQMKVARVFDGDVKIFSNQVYSAIVTKYAMQLPGFPPSGIEEFNGALIEAIIVQETWQKFCYQISEEMFKAAFDAWDKVAKSSNELENLVLAQISKNVWREIMDLPPTETYKELEKQWLKQNDRSEESFRMLLRWHIDTVAKRYASA